MAQASAFWDRIAPRYARSPVADQAAYEHKLKVTRQYFNPDSEVLEFGCGTGSTAIGHAPFVSHILATDISEKMLEIARDKAVDINNLSFEQATIDEIPGEARFDAVLGMSILHLVDDLPGTLSHVHRLLKPGGIFASSTLCMNDAYGWFRFVGPVGRALGLLPQVKMFGKRDFLERVEAAGFEVEYRFQPTRKKPIFLVARKA